MNLRSSILAVTAVGGLALALLSGCSAESRQKVFSIFFDGVQDGKEQAAPPPTRRVRRDLLREIEELKRELAAAREAAKAQKKETTEEGQRPAERAKTWEEVAELLPKDRAGHVDWMQALKAEAIAPRPGLDPKAPEQAVLELDVALASSPTKLFRLTFSHAPHTRWLTCANCHPSLFPLRQGSGPTVITMAKIEAGQSCGACHGSVAFGLEGRCARCHAAGRAATEWRPAEAPRKPIEQISRWEAAAKFLPKTEGEPDWGKALADGVIAPRPGLDPKAEDAPVFPLDVTRIPSGADMFKVVFRHEPHTAWLACESCHPAPFEMKAGATPMSMEKINAGELCGACHGRVAFPATACGRCHPALAGG